MGLAHDGVVTALLISQRQFLPPPITVQIFNRLRLEERRDNGVMPIARSLEGHRFSVEYVWRVTISGSS